VEFSMSHARGDRITMGTSMRSLHER